MELMLSGLNLSFLLVHLGPTSLQVLNISFQSLHLGLVLLFFNNENLLLLGKLGDLCTVRI